jgi:type VI secretion system protein ImpE
MRAEEILREGNLQETLAELQNAARNDPANPKYRVFLFQLMSVMGQWDRALTQLNVAGEMDAGNLAMVQAYREAIRCEGNRERVFAGKVSPLIFGEPDRWLALMIQALKLNAAGQHAEALHLRSEALEAAPATSGNIHVTGEHTFEFQWIADADLRLGPVLEAFLNGQYYWIPFHRIAQIDIEAPADLRDVVWTAAHFTWANGGQTVGFIPTRYPGSDSKEDNLIRLSRKTEWELVGEAQTGEAQTGDELYCGLGQRMLATDVDEYALLDIRKIVLQVESDSQVEADETTSED